MDRHNSQIDRETEIWMDIKPDGQRDGLTWNQMDRKKDGQRDGQRQIDKGLDGESEIWTERQMDRDRWM